MCSPRRGFLPVMAPRRIVIRGAGRADAAAGEGERGLTSRPGGAGRLPGGAAGRDGPSCWRRTGWTRGGGSRSSFESGPPSSAAAFRRTRPGFATGYGSAWTRRGRRAEAPAIRLLGDLVGPRDARALAERGGPAAAVRGCGRDDNLGPTSVSCWARSRPAPPTTGRWRAPSSRGRRTVRSGNWGWRWTRAPCPTWCWASSRGLRGPSLAEPGSRLR